MAETIVLERRFLGPPGSANGGYACGVTAEPISDGPVTATLRRPPPLDRPLQRVEVGDGIELRDGEALITVAEPGQLDLELPEIVTLDAARAARAAFDVSEYAAGHPFPACFTCGPERDPGDGLRIFPGRIARDYPMIAWPWRPDAAFAAGDGKLPVPVIWAALDCPSGLSRVHEGTTPTPHVLGRMTAEVYRRPAPGEQLVAAGWELGEEGRKRFSGSVLWSADGEVLAANRAVWILLSEEQAAAFKGS
ncbi:MAG: hypothetical protein R3343_07790 [Nitriliruptorales bacterium]|nr:hypothetical protein [Nitriliruptorales bacterium]